MLRNKYKKIAGLFFIFLLAINLSSCSGGKRLEGFLVFGSNRNEQFDVFIYENGKLKLLGENGLYPVISPNGDFIAFVKGGGKDQKEFGINIVDKNGKIKKFIKTANPMWGLKWKGNRIYYVMSISKNTGDSKTPNSLFYYDVERKKHNKVIELSVNDWISHYDVSNDGSKIVYEVSEPKTMRFKNMYLFNTVRNTTVALERNIKPVWYPDEKHILCVMHPEKDKHEFGTYWGHFTKYNVETGKKEYLARVPFLELSGMKISRDGEYLYYAGPESIYISPMDDLSKRERITEPVRTRSGWSDDKSPDWYQGE